MLGTISNNKSEINAGIVFITDTFKTGVCISILCVLLILSNNVFRGFVPFMWIPFLLTVLYLVINLVFDDMQRDSVEDTLTHIPLFLLFVFILLFGNMYFTRHSSDVSFFKSADNEITLKCNDTVIKYNPFDVVSYKVTEDRHKNTADVSIVMSDTVVNGTFPSYYAESLDSLLSWGVRSHIINDRYLYNRAYPSLANLYIEVCFPVMWLTGVLSILSYTLVSRKSLHNRTYINVFKTEYYIGVAELVTSMLVATYCFYTMHKMHEYSVDVAVFVMAILLGAYCFHTVFRMFGWFV